MKKLISFIAAAAIALGTVNFAYAEDNVPDTSAAEARLAAMNISADEFFSGDTMSRGSFAEYMTRYLNIPADTAAAYTRFVDVATSSSYVGAVNRLYDLGYISGEGGYYFYPEREITYLEALSIIVNSFGYKLNVQESASWSSGVLNTAQELGILDGVILDYNETAKKPYLIKILDNALEADVITVSLHKETDPVPAAEFFHDVYFVKGIVNGNENTTLTEKNEKPDSNTIYINDQKIQLAESYNDLLGYSVECWYRIEDDENVGIYVEAAAKNIEKELDGDNVEAFTQKSMSYIDDNGNIKKYSTNKAKIIYNGVAYTEYGQPESINFDGTAVKLLDNNGDGTYEVIFITEYEDYYVSSVDIAKYIIYDNENNTSADLAPDKYDVTIYDENGAKTTIDKITKGSVASIASSKNTSGSILKTVYLVSNTVSGKVTGVNAEKGYKISDTYYKKSALCTQSIAFGQQLTAYLGKTGKIAARTLESSSGVFGVLFKIYTDEENDERIYLEFYTQNGEFESFYADEKIKIDGERCTADKATVETKIVPGQVAYIENSGSVIKDIIFPKPESAERGEFRNVASGISLDVRGSNGRFIFAGKVVGESGRTTAMLVPSDPTNKAAYGLFDFEYMTEMRNKTYDIYTRSNEKMNYCDLIVLYDAAVAVLNDDSNMWVVEDKFEGLTNEELPAHMLKLSSAKGGLHSDFVVRDDLDLSLTSGYQNVPVTKIQGVEYSEIDIGDTIAIATNATNEITRIEKIYDYDDPSNANARFKVDQNFVDTCHYYSDSGKYVCMSRLVLTTLDTASDTFIQFKTTYYPSVIDWKNNTNVGWNMEIASMNNDQIILYNTKSHTAKQITRNDLQNYIGNTMILRENTCLMQEVIIYE